MATTAKRVKDAKKPKFKSRQHNRCQLCGRPRAFLRKFGVCRLCFRGLALCALEPQERVRALRGQDRGDAHEGER